MCLWSIRCTGIKQAVHGPAIRDEFPVWQQHYFSWFEQLHLSSLSAVPAKLFEQPSNELDQRADPSVKQHSKINGYFSDGSIPSPVKCASAQTDLTAPRWKKHCMDMNGKLGAID